MWGALSSRAKTNKFNDRDLYHSILDSIRKIENNFRKVQIPQHDITHLPIMDYSDTLRVNDSNIFLKYDGEIEVFNRWSLTPVTCYKPNGIRDVHVNNQFVVIQQWNDPWILVVLDAETLEMIQLIDTTPTSEEVENSCYLYI